MNLDKDILNTDLAVHAIEVLNKVSHCDDSVARESAVKSAYTLLGTEADTSVESINSAVELAHEGIFDTVAEFFKKLFNKEKEKKEKVEEKLSEIEALWKDIEGNLPDHTSVSGTIKLKGFGKDMYTPMSTDNADYQKDFKDIEKHMSMAYANLWLGKFNYNDNKTLVIDKQSVYDAMKKDFDTIKPKVLKRISKGEKEIAKIKLTKPRDLKSVEMDLGEVVSESDKLLKTFKDGIEDAYLEAYFLINDYGITAYKEDEYDEHRPSIATSQRDNAELIEKTASLNKDLRELYAKAYALDLKLLKLLDEAEKNVKVEYDAAYSNIIAIFTKIKDIS